MAQTWNCIVAGALLALGVPGRVAVAQQMPARQTALARGTVRSQAGRPVGGARITTADSTSRTQTDATGGFRLEIPAGRAWELHVTAVGYRPAIVRLAAVNAGTVRIVPVTLAMVYLLDPLSVVANPERPLLNTEHATTGGALERTEIAALPTDARDPIALPKAFLEARASSFRSRACSASTRW